MGYESRLIIAEKYDRNITREDGRKYAEVIATFDLCKVYACSDKFRQYPETNCYVYTYNCNDGFTDMYGQVMREIPIPDAIEILEHAGLDEYRRLAPCLGLLKSFDLTQWSNLVVLHFGY